MADTKYVSIEPNWAALRAYALHGLSVPDNDAGTQTALEMILAECNRARYAGRPDTDWTGTEVKCNCGRWLELHGDARCACGQWFNGFGQQLRNPEFWGEETGERFDSEGRYVGGGEDEDDDNSWKGDGDDQSDGDLPDRLTWSDLQRMEDSF